MIIDKLNPEVLDKVFAIIRDHFKVENVRLLTFDDTTETTLGDIYVQSYWDEDAQTLEHQIVIRNGQLSYKSYYDTMYYRLFKFIEFLDLEVNALSRTVMLICHEYGHINRTNTVYAFNQEDVCDLVDKMTESILDDRRFEMMTIQAIKTDNIDLKYMLTSTEMYADYFALKHFIPVKRSLEKHGIYL